MVFLVLAAQYESWSIPFAVLLGVPFGTLGALLGVWLRGMANDVYVQIGLIVVIGLAAKNAILIVEFANELRAQGRSIREAALEAGRERLRPIPWRWRATDMRRLLLLAFFALIALTAACAVGPGYRRSSLGMPDGWRPRAASEDSLRRFYDSLRTSRDTLLPAGADTARLPFSYDTTSHGPRVDSTAALRWLDLIQDSVLRQLVDTSLRANRDMRTALAVIDEFRAQYRATRGALLPAVTANGQAGRNQTVLGTFGSFTYNQYRATADLSWELDVWGRLRRSTSAARSDLVVRQEDRRALQLSLIGDVATAYFDLRAADLNLALSRRTLDSRRQTLALARRRLDRGLISELDVRQFEADVASPAASVADLERQVAQQENALSVLVGHNPGAIRRGRALTEMAARIPVPAGVPSALLGNRPDVRSAEATLRAATARIGVAQAAWLPTFTLTGQYGTQC